ncbi:MAG: iron-containing alcohol dehydrogenase family protein [Clostridiales bacterium]|nr:iron-containing alcohol dehydrogenase family protein [Clostridiales bacterium]
MENYSICLPSYSIGDSVYNKIGEICEPFGKSVICIGGKTAISKVKEDIIEAVKNTELRIIDFIWYGGEASYENVDALIQNEKVKKADMIFAIGGGKALDTCKALAYKTDKTIFTFPTIASNCAGTTAVSIMYNSDGSFKEPFFFPSPAKHCFIYTKVIAKSPWKYIWAGMGDTYAKYFEASMSSRGEDLVHYHNLGVTTSQLCLYPLLKYGEKALQDFKKGIASFEVEQVILSVVVTTGIASILLTAEHIIDYNTGLAHAVFYALTSYPHIEERHLHGEVVAYGVLILLLVDGDGKMFKTMFDFNKSIGLPTCLADIEMSVDDLEKLVPMVCAMKDIDHNPYKISEDMVFKAFNELEKYNKNF